MKPAGLIILAALFCVAGCAKPQRVALSDGSQGYKIYCDTVRDRCTEDMERICGNRGYNIVSERSDEIAPPLGWIDSGGTRRVNSRYWIEMRCNP